MNTGEHLWEAPNGDTPDRVQNHPALEQVEIDYKYESYIKKEREVVEKISRLENSIIPNGFNYEKIKFKNPKMSGIDR